MPTKSQVSHKSKEPPLLQISQVTFTKYSFPVYSTSCSAATQPAPCLHSIKIIHALHTWSVLSGSYHSGTGCNQQQPPVLCNANAWVTNLFVKTKNESGCRCLKGLLLLLVKISLCSSTEVCPAWALATQQQQPSLHGHSNTNPWLRSALEGSSAQPCKRGRGGEGEKGRFSCWKRPTTIIQSNCLITSVSWAGQATSRRVTCRNAALCPRSWSSS